MKTLILYYILFAAMFVIAVTGQKDDPSDDFDELDDAFGDIMDLDADLDLEESSPDSHVRHLRPAWPDDWPSSGGIPGGYPGGNSGGNSGGSNSGQLQVPQNTPNIRSIPRTVRNRAPSGWNRAKRRGRHYHGFALYTWCDCVFRNWFCFCLDL